MFFFDSSSADELRSAELLVAHQRRTRGPVVRHRTPWWRSFLYGADAPWTSQHELFEGLSRTDHQRAASLLVVRDVRPGQSLGSQGDPRGQFVVIIAGRVGVTIDRAPHAVLDDGSHFGAIPLLDDDRTPVSRATFDVMAPSRIAVAGPNQFRRLIAEFPQVAQRIRAMAEIRRAYLAGVASADRGDRTESLTFPAHLERKIVRL